MAVTIDDGVTTMSFGYRFDKCRSLNDNLRVQCNLRFIDSVIEENSPILGFQYESERIQAFKELWEMVKSDKALRKRPCCLADIERCRARDKQCEKRHKNWFQHNLQACEWCIWRYERADGCSDCFILSKVLKCLYLLCPGEDIIRMTVDDCEILGELIVNGCLEFHPRLEKPHDVEEPWRGLFGDNYVYPAWLLSANLLFISWSRDSWLSEMLKLTVEKFSTYPRVFSLYYRFVKEVIFRKERNAEANSSAGSLRVTRFRPEELLGHFFDLLGLALNENFKVEEIAGDEKSKSLLKIREEIVSCLGLWKEDFTDNIFVGNDNQGPHGYEENSGTGMTERRTELLLLEMLLKLPEVELAELNQLERQGVEIDRTKHSTYMLDVKEHHEKVDRKKKLLHKITGQCLVRFLNVLGTGVVAPQYGYLLVIEKLKRSSNGYVLLSFAEMLCMALDEENRAPVPCTLKNDIFELAIEKIRSLLDSNFPTAELSCIDRLGDIIENDKLDKFYRDLKPFCEGECIFSGNWKVVHEAMLSYWLRIGCSCLESETLCEKLMRRQEHWRSIVNCLRCSHVRPTVCSVLERSLVCMCKVNIVLAKAATDNLFSVLKNTSDVALQIDLLKLLWTVCQHESCRSAFSFFGVEVLDEIFGDAIKAADRIRPLYALRVLCCILNSNQVFREQYKSGGGNTFKKLAEIPIGGVYDFMSYLSVLNILLTGSIPDGLFARVPENEILLFRHFFCLKKMTTVPRHVLSDLEIGLPLLEPLAGLLSGFHVFLEDEDYPDEKLFGVKAALKSLSKFIFCLKVTKNAWHLEGTIVDNIIELGKCIVSNHFEMCSFYTVSTSVLPRKAGREFEKVIGTGVCKNMLEVAERIYIKLGEYAVEQYLNPQAKFDFDVDRKELVLQLDHLDVSRSYGNSYKSHFTGFIIDFVLKQQNDEYMKIGIDHFERAIEAEPNAWRGCMERILHSCVDLTKMQRLIVLVFKLSATRHDLMSSIEFLDKYSSDSHVIINAMRDCIHSNIFIQCVFVLGGLNIIIYALGRSKSIGQSNLWYLMSDMVKQSENFKVLFDNICGYDLLSRFLENIPLQCISRSTVKAVLYFCCDGLDDCEYFDDACWKGAKFRDYAGIQKLLLNFCIWRESDIKEFVAGILEGLILDDYNAAFLVKNSAFQCILSVLEEQSTLSCTLSSPTCERLTSCLKRLISLGDLKEDLHCLRNAICLLSSQPERAERISESLLETLVFIIELKCKDCSGLATIIEVFSVIDIIALLPKFGGCGFCYLLKAIVLFLSEEESSAVKIFLRCGSLMVMDAISKLGSLTSEMWFEVARFCSLDSIRKLGKTFSKNCSCLILKCISLSATPGHENVLEQILQFCEMRISGMDDSGRKAFVDSGLIRHIAELVDKGMSVSLLVPFAAQINCKFLRSRKGLDFFTESLFYFTKNENEYIEEFLKGLKDVLQYVASQRTSISDVGVTMVIKTLIDFCVGVCYNSSAPNKEYLLSVFNVFFQAILDIIESEINKCKSMCASEFEYFASIAEYKAFVNLGEQVVCILKALNDGKHSHRSCRKIEKELEENGQTIPASKIEQTRVDMTKTARKWESERKKLCEKRDKTMKMQNTYDDKVLQDRCKSIKEYANEIQKTNLEKRIKHSIKVDSYWQRVLDTMNAEGMPFESDCIETGWMLDSTEGPDRMRIRLKKCLPFTALSEVKKQPSHILSHLLSKPIECKSESESEDAPSTQPKPIESMPDCEREDGPSTLPKDWGDVYSCTKLDQCTLFKGFLIVSKKYMYFLCMKSLVSENIDICLQHHEKNRAWDVNQMSQAHRRHYLQEEKGIEIFFKCGQPSIFVVFEDNKTMEVALKMIYNFEVEGFTNYEDIVAGSIFLRSMRQRWEDGEISNYSYLIILNTLAGRSFNHLHQYPIIPHILKDFYSPVLDLTSPQTFRDLSKPMGAQGSRRLEEFIQRRNDLIEFGHEPYHYGTIYSTCMSTLNFLIRVRPYPEEFLKIQGKKWDFPDRMFHSIEGSWRNSSEVSRSDVRELIPELFCLAECLVNLNEFDLGKKENGDKINNVVLPKWCHDDPYMFIYEHRRALESEYVSEHLHMWIDNVFGYTQRGEEAARALNTFHPLTYGAGGTENAVSDVQREGALQQRMMFGQIPKQLFKKPHGKKKITPLRVCLHAANVKMCCIWESESSKTECSLDLLNGKVLLWTEATLEVRTAKKYANESLTYHNLLNDPVNVAEMSRLTNQVFLGGNSGVITVWSMNEVDDGLKFKCSLHGHYDKIVSIAVSDAYQVILSAGLDNSVILWDLNTLVAVRRVEEEEGRVIKRLAISPHSGFIAMISQSEHCHVSVFTINMKRLKHHEYKETLTDVAFYRCRNFVHDELLLAITTDCKLLLIKGFNLTEIREEDMSVYMSKEISPLKTIMVDEKENTVILRNEKKVIKAFTFRTGS
eukprot:Nk52_evm47s745 gene=Nk52_evmTU47s745